jgi:hypothetical protein
VDVFEIDSDVADTNFYFAAVALYSYLASLFKRGHAVKHSRCRCKKALGGLVVVEADQVTAHHRLKDLKPIQKSLENVACRKVCVQRETYFCVDFALAQVERH